jgi:hypothetical protein
MALRVSVMVLMILASFLVFLLLLEDLPNLATVFGLLATVIVCVILSSWMALGGETTHENVLLISLLLASGLFLLLSFFYTLDAATLSPAWRDYHPTAVYNLSVTTFSFLGLAFVLGAEAIAVLLSILRARGK